MIDTLAYYCAKTGDVDFFYPGDFSCDTLSANIHDTGIWCSPFLVGASGNCSIVVVSSCKVIMGQNKNYNIFVMKVYKPVVCSFFFTTEFSKDIIFFII